MDCFIKIAYSLILFVSIAHSQEVMDSIKLSNLSITPNSTFNLDDLDFYLDMKSLNKSLLLNEDSNTKWLWTSYAISSQAVFQPNENFDDMTLPLYQKYLEDSKFNPFRYALGMVQVGAVGYLAYKHIKKYGFLKK